MNLTIERLDGTRHNTEDFSLAVTDFRVSSPSPIHNWEESDGTDGVRDLGTTHGPRPINASFEFVSQDYYDFPLLRNEIFQLFLSKEPFYLIDSREPGKRWLVKGNSFSPEQIVITVGRFNIEFTAFRGYAESIGTTLDPKTFDSELWQIGQGLITNQTDYVHNTSSFRIYNAGTEIIDPKKFPLIIKYKGASSNLQIKNNTTLETWSYTGTTTADNTIELNRLRSLKDSVVNIFADTNRRSISLAPGWNDIELIGTSGSFEISFDFRFYYV